MSAFSDYAEAAIINELLRNTNLAAVAQPYVALHVGAPGDAGANNEITALGGYARKAGTFSAPSGGVTSNSGAITFGPATENWGSVDNVSIWDAETGGNCLFVGALTAAKTVNNGDSLQFAATALQVTVA